MRWWCEGNVNRRFVDNNEIAEIQGFRDCSHESLPWPMGHATRPNFQTRQLRSLPLWLAVDGTVKIQANQRENMVRGMCVITKKQDE